MHISECAQLGIKFFIFGGYGTGKTTFASTLPQPIYFFDFDRGVRSVASRLKSSGDLEDAKIDFDIYVDNRTKRTKNAFVDESYLQTILTSPQAYLHFEDKLNEILTATEKAADLGNPAPYRTVVVDSLSTLSTAFLSYIMSVNKDQGRVFAVPNQNDYGNFIRKMEEVLGMFHMLADHGVHTVVTAHMQIKEDMRGPKDSKGNQPIFRGIFRTAAIVGKDLPFKIGALFDEVYYAFAKREGDTSDYFFETKSDDDLFCKSRSPNLKAVIPQDWGLISKNLLDETAAKVKPEPRKEREDTSTEDEESKGGEAEN